MLLILTKVYKLHAITSGKVTLGLDGDHALKASGAEYLVPQQADFDLLCEIHRLCDALPIDVA